MSGWLGHRKAVPAYWGEEWHATRDWHYERIVLDSIDYHMRVKLEVTIHGVPKSGPKPKDYDACPPSRPKSFYATLTSRGATCAFARGTCHSIKSALYKVDSVPLDEALRFFLYTMQWRGRAKTIFREDPKTGEYEAFCTEIGSPWSNPEYLPNGRYAALGWHTYYREDRGLTFMEIDRNGWGYGTSSVGVDYKRIDPSVIAQLPFPSRAEYERAEAEHQAELRRRYDAGYPQLGKQRAKKRIA